MYNRLISVMRLPEHERHAKERLKLFYQVTRQAALREAADIVAAFMLDSQGRILDGDTVLFIHEHLDGLASEGG